MHNTNHLHHPITATHTTHTPTAAMASVLHPPLPLSHHRTSSSKSASTSVTNFPTTHKVHHSPTLHRRSSCDFKNDVICRSSSGEVTFIEPPESPPSTDDLIGSLKIKLLIDLHCGPFLINRVRLFRQEHVRKFNFKVLAEVGQTLKLQEELLVDSASCVPVNKSAVSGLNRGLAASEDDLRKADDAAKELEAAGGPVDLSADLDKLQGRWRLIYSSAFSSRTLGGSRPGPPTGRLLPITLGQVFQRIDIFSKDFDNIVELELGAPWPLPPLEVTATLAHKYELIGTSGIKIIFDKTTVKTTGNLSQLPPFDIPRIPDGLRPPSNTGSGEFEVTYLDSDTRVTRGDRGELRVFVIA